MRKPRKEIEMTAKGSLVSLGVFAVGCINAPTASQRIEVADHNGLAVVAIVIDRFEDNTGTVFELRGVDASDRQVALVRRRIGTIADLPQYLSGTKTSGSEIVFSVTGTTAERTLTRETGRIRLPPDSDPIIRAFLDIPTVSSTLDREANIAVTKPQAPTVRSEQAYSSCGDGYCDAGEDCPGDCGPSNCLAGNMLNNSLAAQCCWAAPNGNDYFTEHIDPNNRYVIRYQNYPYDGNGDPVSQSALGCKAYDGYSSCSGTDCYYGPAGFARPFVSGHGYYANDDYEVWTPDYVYLNNKLVWIGEWSCQVEWYDTPQTPSFSDVSGSFPASQGCPGGDDGAGEWDY